jgi:hypothetical protein
MSSRHLLCVPIIQTIYSVQYSWLLVIADRQRDESTRKDSLTTTILARLIHTHICLDAA